MGIQKLAFKRFVRFFVPGIIFFFLFKNLYNSWSKITGYEWQFNYPSLIISFVLVLGAFVVSAWGWKLVLNRMGENTDLLTSLIIYILSLPARYIPGSIWSEVGRFYLAEKEGIPKAKIVVSIVLDKMLMIVSSSMIALVSFSFWPERGVSFKTLPFLLVIPAGLVFLHPSLLKASINFALRKAKREEISIDLEYKDIIFLLGFHCFISWGINGIAFFFLADSTFDIPVSVLPAFIGIYATGWVIGQVSIFVPNGLGVREGIFALLFSYYMPSGMGTVVALLSRVWVTIAELLWVCVIASVSRKRKGMYWT